MSYTWKDFSSSGVAPATRPTTTATSSRQDAITARIAAIPTHLIEPLIPARRNEVHRLVLPRSPPEERHRDRSDNEKRPDSASKRTDLPLIPGGVDPTVVAKLKVENETLRGEAAAMLEQLEDAKVKFTDLWTKHKTLQAKLGSKEAGLAEKVEESNKMKAQYEASIKMEQDKFGKLSEKHSELGKQHRALQKELEELRTKHQRQSEEFAALQASDNDVQQALAELQGKHTQLLGDHQALQDRHSQLTATSFEAVEARSRLEAQLQALQAQHDELQRSATELQTRLGIAEAQKAALETDSGSAQSQLATQQETVGRLEAQFNEQRAALEAAQLRAAELEKQAESSKDLREAHAKSEQRLKEADEALAKLRGEYAAIEASSKSHADTVETLTKQLKEKSLELEAARKGKATAEPPPESWKEVRPGEPRGDMRSTPFEIKHDVCLVFLESGTAAATAVARDFAARQIDFVPLDATAVMNGWDAGGVERAVSECRSVVVVVTQWTLDSPAVQFVVACAKAYLQPVRLVHVYGSCPVPGPNSLPAAMHWLFAHVPVTLVDGYEAEACVALARSIDELNKLYTMAAGFWTSAVKSANKGLDQLALLFEEAYRGMDPPTLLACIPPEIQTVPDEAEFHYRTFQACMPGFQLTLQALRAVPPISLDELQTRVLASDEFQRMRRRQDNLYAADVFVCFERTGLAAAIHLAEGLRNEGFAVAVGTDPSLGLDTLRRYIMNARAFVLILTEGVLDSYLAMQQLRMAVELAKPVLFVVDAALRLPSEAADWPEALKDLSTVFGQFPKFPWLVEYNAACIARLARALPASTSKERLRDNALPCIDAQTGALGLMLGEPCTAFFAGSLAAFLKQYDTPYVERFESVRGCGLDLTPLDGSLPEALFSAMSAADLVPYPGIKRLVSSGRSVLQGPAVDDDSASFQLIYPHGRNFTDEHLAMLQAMFPNLTELSLGNCDLVTSAAMQSLAGLAKLRHLRLNGFLSFTDLDFRQLAASCPALEVVELLGTSDPHPGLLFLLLELKNLKALSVEQTDIFTDNDVLSLTEPMPTLTALRLVHCRGLSPAGLRHLLALLPNLRELRIVAPKSPVEYLAAATTTLATLEIRPINGNRRDDLNGTKPEFASVPFDPALIRLLTITRLDLSLVSIGDDAMIELAAGLPKLQALVLRNCLITDGGTEALVACPDIMFLGLAGSIKLTEKGFARLGQLKKLQSLDLSGCAATDATLAVLSGQCPLLYKLVLNGCPLLTADALASLSRPVSLIEALNTQLAVRTDQRANGVLAGVRYLGLQAKVIGDPVVPMLRLGGQKLFVTIDDAPWDDNWLAQARNYLQVIKAGSDAEQAAASASISALYDRHEQSPWFQPSSPSAKVINFARYLVRRYASNGQTVAVGEIGALIEHLMLEFGVEPARSVALLEESQQAEFNLLDVHRVVWECAADVMPWFDFSNYA